MTKDEYISEAISYVGRIDNTRRVHPRVVEAALSNAINTVWSVIYEQNPHDVSLYTKTYENVDVTGEKTYLTDDYTESGEAIDMVNLPRIGGGVISVRPVGDNDIMFFPISIRDAMFQSRLESSNYTLDVGYIVRGNELEYIGIPSEITQVDVDVVRSFTEYGYEETFYMPWRQEDVMNMVLTKLGIATPVSLKNNNSDEHGRG